MATAEKKKGFVLAKKGQNPFAKKGQNPFAKKGSEEEDPADTNGDGKVSKKEKSAARLKALKNLEKK